MTSQPTYQIHTQAPNPVRLEDYGINPQGDRGPRFTQTIFEASLTEDEFHLIFPDRNLVDAMCRESCDSDNYTIRIYASDVLACEGNGNSHQDRLILAFTEREGLPNPCPEALPAAARDYASITPAALELLLELADDYPDPDDIDTSLALARADALGLTLGDYLHVPHLSQSRS